MQLLVEETNRYDHQYLDTLHEGSSPLPDLTIQEMYLFLSITAQMGHDQKDRIKDYWSILEEFYGLLQKQWNEIDSSMYWDFYTLWQQKWTW
jgi:hypothetical protein